ncbi:hypothetical protein [Paraclostridium sordellii]|uniref:hypothetical protein n=1 Tax=Paraclostridium sordellii TaxID=1505 RepID=UPI0005E6DA5A|nr:hypothetical protein [Paeniclostridium sordellii]CEN26610.1 Uncharacterised protein [[Clostridium] sordellii] [Paeniclostridium sordellii]CEP50438.1 Uncharacterised protein [[Clostridium] sordellii] [Paeniclostridium sordellii]
MSKINLNIDNKFVAEIENKAEELNNHVVFVENKYIKELEQANIPYKQFTSKDYYLVRRGKKPKKFNDKQVEYIKKDLLENKISIRKASEKYKCSTKTIQQIKNNTY